jgi:hypothetical protein
VHADNSSTQEAEGLTAEGHPGLYSKTLSLKTEKVNLNIE